ncbi:MAG: prepilin peptidase [Pseudomonadota bacterium]
MIDTENILIILPVIFLVGICFGSFVTMASYRLPLDSDIVFKPSYCPKCNTQLGIIDLFPLISWLRQKGKCLHCKNPISARYPLIEFALGIIFVIIFYNFGISVESCFLSLLATELMILIVTDFEHYIIPDSIQVAVLITGVLYRLYIGSDLLDIFSGCATGLTIGLSLHYGYLYIRNIDALSFGDVKFLAAAGSWLTLTDFIPFLFIAGLVGVFTGLFWRFIGRGAIFPFGPALAFSLFINVLIPDMMGIYCSHFKNTFFEM